jgi:hypothetical protein
MAGNIVKSIAVISSLISVGEIGEDGGDQEAWNLVSMGRERNVLPLYPFIVFRDRLKPVFGSLLFAGVMVCEEQVWDAPG